MKGKKFEEYKMELIAFDKDIIRTSGGENSVETTEPGGEGWDDDEEE